MNVAYDKKLTISIGKNREEKRWKNKNILWSELLERLSKTYRTNETESEYLNSTKSRRDEIKDIGGFVGGNISGGRRKKGAVISRSIITLDLDYVQPKYDVWGLYTMLHESAACLYSTHSHTVEAPRLRLIIPLDRDIDPEEYQPIARKIAGELDIEIFDNTTFQTERLMYWPSTPKDGQYVFMFQDGPLLVADDVLDSYFDWKDASQWPVSAKAVEAVKRGIKKQGDPLEKPGIIGAFNRTFSIEDAITEYLNETYDKADAPDRYTYREGSTAAGLVVYEDKFAYSHHGTDPISEKLCNAFDLVRVHLFNDLDDQSDEHTPINHRPSFAAMRELALQNKKVCKALVSERLASAQEDFADLELPDDTSEPEGQGETGETEILDNWLETLELDQKGNIKSTIDNLVIILNNDRRLRGVIAIDEFRNNLVKRKPFKWDKVHRYLFADHDEAYLRRYVERKYGIVGAGRIRDAIDIIGNDNIFHPVRDYINGLQWDGESRIDELLIKFMGADDNEYTRAVTRKALVAAVARVFEPGCKFDYMLMLQGPQGIKKSTFFSVLGGEWYNKNFTFSMIGSKEAIEQLQGSWINEVGELDGLSRAEVNSVKNFIDITRDAMRPAYGRYKMEYLRQGIFVGTFNEEAPLRDQTGGRRFWPVKVKRMAESQKLFKELKSLTPQIWAEAYTLYMGGETLYLNDQLEETANKIQEDFTEKDVRLGDLIRYLDMKVPDNWYDMDQWQRREYVQGDPLQKEGVKVRDRITVMEIWVELFGGSVKDISKRDSREINDMMNDAKKWEACRFGKDGSRERGFRRKNRFRQLDVGSDATSLLN